MKQAQLFCLSLFLLQTQLAAAGSVAIVWDPQANFQYEGSLKPTEILELCGKLSAATTIDWSFNASQALVSSVYFRQGDTPKNLAQFPSRERLSYHINLSAAQEYCWKWINTNPKPAQIKVNLTRVSK